VESVAAYVLGPPPDGWPGFFTNNTTVMLGVAAGILGADAARGASPEDVVSNVIAKLIKRGIPNEVNARAYVLTAVRNAAYDERKPLKRHTDEDVVFDDLVGVSGIDDDVNYQLLIDQVIVALDELPEREAYAIREKFLHERHWSDVATELGVTTSQGFGKIVNAGLDKLRQMPRFAGLANGGSTSPNPSSTSTGETTGTKP